MQVLLTEEEYIDFKNCKDLYDNLNKRYHNLKNTYSELDEKYNKLLIFGTVTTNEKLKGE